MKIEPVKSYKKPRYLLRAMTILTAAGSLTGCTEAQLAGDVQMKPEPETCETEVQIDGAMEVCTDYTEPETETETTETTTKSATTTEEQEIELVGDVVSIPEGEPVQPGWTDTYEERNDEPRVTTAPKATTALKPTTTTGTTTKAVIKSTTTTGTTTRISYAGVTVLPTETTTEPALAGVPLVRTETTTELTLAGVPLVRTETTTEPVELGGDPMPYMDED